MTNNPNFYKKYMGNQMTKEEAALTYAQKCYGDNQKYAYDMLTAKGHFIAGYDYADPIGFQKWMGKYFFRFGTTKDVDIYLSKKDLHDKTEYTTEQLYQIFKTEQENGK